MIKDRIFTTALFISILLHATFLVNWPAPHQIFFKKITPYNKLEVTYYNLKEPVKLLDLFSPSIEKKLPVGSLDKKVSTPVQKQTILKKEPISDQKKKIESEKIIKEVFNMPKPVIIDLKSNLKAKNGYIGYDKLVREKLRRAAILNRPKQFQEGNVCVAFSVKKDGFLEGLKIINSRTSASAILKELALKSVRDASPFAPIPKELRQDIIHFSVVISFVLEK